MNKEQNNKNSIIKNIMIEEDMFPKNFTNFKKEKFGVLFYNELNKNSYDSNHAVIYKNRVKNLREVLGYITEFYKQMKIHPSIYQAAEDKDFFDENKTTFNENGYSILTEKPDPMSVMILAEESVIKNTNQLNIKLINKWDESIASDICEPSDEKHEIEVIKKSILNPNYRVFVGYKDRKAVAITYFHISDFDCCRFDYIIISKEFRKKGYARELLEYVTNYCRVNGYKNCFQWPAHKTSEKICIEAGFRHLFTIKAGRASYNNKV